MRLADYDPVDLAEKAGSMQLLPENADFYVEMLRCAALTAAQATDEEGLFKIPDQAWHQWINSDEPMANAPELGGDPHEGLFVAEVPCFGGGYLTLPADAPDDAFIVECLLEAALLRLSVSDREFNRQIAEIAVSGLWISDQCIRRAGLSRHTEPSTTDNGEIRWPAGRAARELQAAVSFSSLEVSEALSELGVGDGGIQELGFRVGDLSNGYATNLTNPLRTRPLLLANDRIVVISPMTLLIAIRHAVLKIARSLSIEKELFDAYRLAVQSRVEKYADLMQWRGLNRTSVEIHGTAVCQLGYQFDSDKVATVFVVCDDLKSGPTASEDSFWDLSPLIQEVDSLAQTLQKKFFDSEHPPSEILYLLVVQGVGRFHSLGLNDINDNRVTSLAITAGELQIFTLLNLNDELALWHVARARDQLPQSTGIGLPPISVPGVMRVRVG